MCEHCGHGKDKTRPFPVRMTDALIDRIPEPKGTHIRELVEREWGKAVCRELSGKDVPADLSGTV